MGVSTSRPSKSHARSPRVPSTGDEPPAADDVCTLVAISKPELLDKQDCRVKTEIKLREASKKGWLRVISGANFSSVLVGGRRGRDTWAQIPPAKGDTWEIDIDTEIGAYSIQFLGGSNPHHGILTVYIDGEEVGNFDQYQGQDVFPAMHEIHWECETPGKHTLRATVNDKINCSHNYWICLNSITLQPVKSRRCLALSVHGVWQACGKLRVSCLSLAGAEVLVLDCDAHVTVGQLRDLASSELDMAWRIALALPDGKLLEEKDDASLLSQVLVPERLST